VTVIELDELGRPAELSLTPGEGRLLAASEVVTAVPSPYQPVIWHVAAAGQVGTARIGDMTVHIRPKVPVARLLFLLGYALHGAAWPPGTVPVASAPDLVSAIAQALWRQTERAPHQGLLPGYVTIEESLPVLRDMPTQCLGGPSHSTSTRLNRSIFNSPDQWQQFDLHRTCFARSARSMIVVSSAGVS